MDGRMCTIDEQHDVGNMGSYHLQSYELSHKP